MSNMLQKARSGRAKALKSIAGQRIVGETFVLSNGRRYNRPSKTPQTLMFTSVRSERPQDPVAPVTAARIKAEKAFLAASVPVTVQGALLH